MNCTDRNVGRNGAAAAVGEATMKARSVLFGLLMLSAALPLTAKDALAVKVSPAVCFAPANLIVRATVESNASNRAVEIVAESDDFYRSSELQLDGDRAPRTTMFEFRSLPPGMYEVRAILYGSDGDARAEVRRQVNVIASGAGH